MGQFDKIKFRHEYKYIINEIDKAKLEIYAKGVLRADKHADKDGEYIIRSLYFDGIDDFCYYENEAGIDLRSKYRIRFYNYNSDRIALEKKSKVRNMTNKVSCPISREQCEIFMSGQIPEYDENISGKQKVLFTEMRMKSMRPTVIVQYLRKPFVYGPGNVRVTFDGSICSSNDISDFLKKDITLRPILIRGESVLEVKWDEFLPEYIKNSLELDSLRWSSFSKYSLCRKYNCYGGVRI